MSPFFFGCRCCHIPQYPECTHRVFTSDGELVWSWLHNGMSQTDEQRTLWRVGIDNGGRVISQSPNYGGGNFYGVDSWQISDGSDVLIGADRVHTVTEFEHYFPAADGSIYEVASVFSQNLRKYDSTFSQIWARNINDFVPAVTNQIASFSGECSMNESETIVGAAIKRNITAGLTPISGGGAAVFDSEGNLLFVIEDHWKSYPFSDGSQSAPAEFRIDTAGFIYLFFQGQVTRISDPGVDHGNVWIYSADGDFLRAINADGIQANSRYIDVIGDSLIVAGTVVSLSGSSEITLRTYSVTTGAVVSSIVLSAYGTRILITKSDRAGNVYTLVQNGSQLRTKVVALDSSLNPKWMFFENEAIDSNSGAALYPVHILHGVKCAENYVVIGGGTKGVDFDPSQLVIY